MAETERTADGRWIEVDGRRWRASDPDIPDAFRAELVAELMAARRAVGQAGRTGDVQETSRARARVRDAKVALGERGRPWWETADQAAQEERMQSTIFALLSRRDGRSICPSDVARVVGGQAWRSQMDQVRQVVFRLAEQGRVRITQRGEQVATEPAPRGPIRITTLGDRPGCRT